ncbi:MAG: urease accessory UreF family protein [Chloroflexota bacterium]
MEDAALLALLQLADSGFPSGAYVLSHGLETLAAEGWVRDGADLAAVVRAQLLERAARADLPVLLAAHVLGEDGPDGADGADGVGGLMTLDRRLDRVKLAREEREGSMRVGRRLLEEGARLYPGSATLAGMRAAARAGATPGHAAVAQGLVARAAGVEARTAALAAAAGLTSGLLTAAVRLGRIGHGEAQRRLQAAHPVILAAVDVALVADPADLRPSSPVLDVALARHERADVRAFAS